jgi:uncharacterized protein YbjT (DUF2867 family)
VLRSLVQNKSFKINAISRNPSSKPAQELRAMGVEVIQANGWNKEEIRAAFAGSWAAFVNTNSEDPVGFNLTSLPSDKLTHANYLPLRAIAIP